MAKAKFDVVVEAVRYNEDGDVLWVRAYQRRGPTWSDRVLLDRHVLVAQLKAGKRYVFGRRVPQYAGTFEIFTPITVIERDGREILVTGQALSGRDCLVGVPLL